MANNEPRKIAKNLYIDDETKKYFRLFAVGITPNNCWLICPEYRELKNINITTGKDIYGNDFYLVPDNIGTIPASNEFIKL